MPAAAIPGVASAGAIDRPSRVEPDGSAERPFLVGDLAAYLIGCWSIDRRIVNSRRENALFLGFATVSSVGPHLLDYREIGALGTKDASLEARRRLSLRLTSCAEAEVRFAGGTPFHRLDLSTGRCKVDFSCAADRYGGCFVTLSRDALFVRWRVRGREKSYTSRSRYVRAADDAVIL